MHVARDDLLLREPRREWGLQGWMKNKVYPRLPHST
jgi:hypothetical protein